MPLDLEYENEYWETRYWDEDITKALNEMDEREDMESDTCSLDYSEGD